MNRLKFTILISLFPMCLLAHGEDKLGQNGGYIRMPGGFHTEVMISDNKLLVYLLDINWKDPVTEKSSVFAEYSQKGTSSSLTCSATGNHFSCQLPKHFKASDGQFYVQADRMGMKGAKAEYLLPLKLISPEVDHSKH